jgi:hypothetical protein
MLTNRPSASVAEQADQPPLQPMPAGKLVPFCGSPEQGQGGAIEDFTQSSRVHFKRHIPELAPPAKNHSWRSCVTPAFAYRNAAGTESTSSDESSFCLFAAIKKTQSLSAIAPRSFWGDYNAHTMVDCRPPRGSRRRLLDLVLDLGRSLHSLRRRSCENEEKQGQGVCRQDS